MQKKNVRDFEEAVAYLDDTPRFTAKNTMEDTRAFLHRLGNPDGKLRIVHVAGTNGKGSVCAYLRSILEAAGYRVAVFTSPHLVDVRERFVVEGEMITKEDFFRIFQKIYDMLDWEADACPYHPTYFEYLFFIAMVLFAERRPDFCILETGLGGRLDATNSVSKKELAVITHLSLDHVEYLGDTVEKIAGEKAGILQAGAPAVYWDTCPAASAVIEARAANLGVTTHAVSKRDYRFLHFRNKSIDFSVRTRYYNYISLTLRTMAAYQMENAALAVRAAEVLDGGRTITEGHVRQGVRDCFWAGRMEEVLPEVYVDGAHNEDGMRAFLETVAADGHDGPRVLLFGVVKDKDYEQMVKEIEDSGLFCRILAAELKTGRSVSGEKLQGLLERYPGCHFSVYDNVAAAFRELVHSRRERERAYVAGSLYLVGEIKELLKNDQF